MQRCVRLSFILIVMTHLSCNLFLETAVGRAPPYDELAGMTFHFLWVVGMVLCVNKHAWLAITLRVSAPVYGMPVRLVTWAAPVSWMLVRLETWAAPVTWMPVFDFAKQGSLSSAPNRRPRQVGFCSSLPAGTDAQKLRLRIPL